ELFCARVVVESCYYCNHWLSFFRIETSFRMLKQRVSRPLVRMCRPTSLLSRRPRKPSRKESDHRDHECRKLARPLASPTKDGHWGQNKLNRLMTSAARSPRCPRNRLGRPQPQPQTMLTVLTQKLSPFG